MRNNRNTVKNIYERLFPFICLFVIFFVLHMTTFEWRGDDVGNMANFSGNSLLENIRSEITNSNGWSSRIIINAFIGVTVYWLADITSIYSWMIIDSLFFVLIAWSLNKIMCTLFKIEKNNKKQLTWTISGLLMIFPYHILNSAGWLATTYTYLWPIGIGLWTISEYIEGLYIKRAWWKYILYGMALLVSVNLEGFSVCAAVIFLTLLIMEIINKKIHYSTIEYLLISVFSVFTHLFNSGNENRIMAEIRMNFPSWNMLNIIDKADIAFARFVYEFVFNYNAVFVIFAICLFGAVFHKTEDVLYRTIAAFPLAIALIFSVLGNNLQLYTGLSGINAMLVDEGTIRVDNYMGVSGYLPILIGGWVCISILISFYVLSDNVRHFVISVGIFLGGIGSWMIMMFSPTVWASQERPFICLYFVFLFLTIVLIYCSPKSENSLKKSELIVGMFAVCSLLNELLM